VKPEHLFRLSSSSPSDVLCELQAFRSCVITNGPWVTKPHIEEQLLANCCVGRDGVKVFKLWYTTPYARDGCTLLPDRKPDYMFILKPGDVLFIPSGMWHEVTTTTERAILDGFVFKDNSVLKNLGRQVDQVYHFLRAGNVYNEDIEEIVDKMELKIPRRLTSSYCGFRSKKLSKMADTLKRKYIEEQGKGTSRRDRIGRKRRKRCCLSERKRKRLKTDGTSLTMEQT
jgi:Cupin superfamily protein